MGDQAGAARALQALFCCNGGFNVMLRLPGQAIANDAGEELGLAAPQFQDLPVGPAVWGRTGEDKELLMSGSALTALAGALDFGSVNGLLSTAAGVVISGIVYQILQTSPLMTGCSPSAFRLLLQAPKGPWTAA